jgi:hypothetical protein
VFLGVECFGQQKNSWMSEILFRIVWTATTTIASITYIWCRGHFTVYFARLRDIFQAILARKPFQPMKSPWYLDIPFLLPINLSPERVNRLFMPLSHFRHCCCPDTMDTMEDTMSSSFFVGARTWSRCCCCFMLLPAKGQSVKHVTSLAEAL